MSTTRQTNITVVVDENGKVEIPGALPGEGLSLTVERQAVPGPPYRTPEEEKLVDERMAAIGEWFSEGLTDEQRALIRNHADWLYDKDGLPK